MNVENKTTAELEARDAEITRNLRALTQWHNRNMSRKDRELFTSIYREESKAITAELMRREGEAA
jgi:hypothetical protein